MSCMSYLNDNYQHLHCKFGFFACAACLSYAERRCKYIWDHPKECVTSRCLLRRLKLPAWWETTYGSLMQRVKKCCFKTMVILQCWVRKSLGSVISLVISRSFLRSTCSLFFWAWVLASACGRTLATPQASKSVLLIWLDDWHFGPRIQCVSGSPRSMPQNSVGFRLKVKTLLFVGSCGQILWCRIIQASLAWQILTGQTW